MVSNSFYEYIATGCGRLTMTHDNWGRMIRSDRQNDHGLLTELYQTNLAGQITWSSQAFTPKSGATYNLEQSNTYDNAGRINQWEASLGGKTAGASLTYGKYGKVDTESFHNGVARNYAYDCHGWLTDIDTKVKVSRLSLIQPSLSADYYSQALTLGPDASTIVTPEPSWDYKTYTEWVSYADGTFPRYDGTASAHRSSLGGEYSYRFDTHDRLIGAKYTPGPDNPTDEDFSVSYRYNETGAPLTLSRKGVIASTILVDGSFTERFGDIDRLTYNYDGVLLTDITAERMGLNFYGRVGFPLSEQGGTASRLWNAAGLLKADTSQGIASVTYNHLGQPLTVTFADKSQVLYSYSYDGRLQQIEYGERSGTASVGFTRVKNRRYYDGNFIFEDDSLSMANFPGGYFDGKGQPYYRHSDWQGSVAMVTNGNGSLVQHNGYYPYGEPWRVVEGQPYLYGGKERLTNNDNIEYDFGARRYHSASALWSTPDPAAIKFPAQNPYVFCAANPIKYVDPTGCEVQGISKKDAKLAVMDFRAMLPGEDLERFRQLIQLNNTKGTNKKALAKISQEDKAKALEGVNLTEDQQALIDIMVDVINSESVFKVEYNTLGSELSKAALIEYGSEIDELPDDVHKYMSQHSLTGADILRFNYGDGYTKVTSSGAISVISKTISKKDTNRPATLGHELIGHGYAYSLGLIDRAMQHTIPIQTENLILRTMGVNSHRDGTDHGPVRTFIPNYNAIPSFK